MIPKDSSSLHTCHESLFQPQQELHINRNTLLTAHNMKSPTVMSPLSIGQLIAKINLEAASYPLSWKDISHKIKHITSQNYTPKYIERCATTYVKLHEISKEERKEVDRYIIEIYSNFQKKDENPLVIWQKVADTLCVKLGHMFNPCNLQQRYKDYLDPQYNNDPITTEEGNLILELAEKHGNLWETIANELQKQTGSKAQRAPYLLKKWLYTYQQQHDLLHTTNNTDIQHTAPSPEGLQQHHQHKKKRKIDSCEQYQMLFDKLSENSTVGSTLARTTARPKTRKPAIYPLRNWYNTNFVQAKEQNATFSQLDTINPTKENFDPPQEAVFPAQQSLSYETSNKPYLEQEEPLQLEEQDTFSLVQTPEIRFEEDDQTQSEVCAFNEFFDFSYFDNASFD